MKLKRFFNLLLVAGVLSIPTADGATGTVKWFNPTKGYGFIAPDDGGADVFVHFSELEGAGISQLNNGEKVSFEIVHKAGKPQAKNLSKEN